MLVRWFVCHVVGVLIAAAAVPYLLAAGWRVDNIVMAGILGLVVFLVLAAVGGYVIRGALARWPIRSALAVPFAAIGATYLLLRALDGFAAETARLAFEAATIAGLAASASSALHLLGIAVARSARAMPNGAERP